MPGFSTPTELPPQRPLGSELANALFRAALANLFVELGKEDLRWLEAMDGTLDTRYRSGQSTLVETLQVQNERVRRATRLENDTAQLGHAYVALNRFLNRELDAPWPQFQLPDLAAPVVFNQKLIEYALRYEPRSEVKRLEILRAETGVELAKRKSRPDVSAGLEARNYTGNGDFKQGVLLLSMSLPGANNSKYGQDKKPSPNDCRFGTHFTSPGFAIRGSRFDGPDCGEHPPPLISCCPNASSPLHCTALAMKCFVTGASGFIGANLVHALNARGHEVRALLRPGSRLSGLAGAKYEPVSGDLSDIKKLKDYARGCDWCFHVAANYHLWLQDYAAMYETNVEGTRRMLQAAADAGCSRIVHTSTVGCIGLPDTRNGSVRPTDETAPVSEAQMSNHYKRSKWRAEQVALGMARQGLPIVVVNPSAPIGPRDAKPTPTGKVIVDFLNRRMPAYLDTGWNWVHVEDVAVGHILAAERGRIGERYVLGNAQGNWTMSKAFAVLQELSEVPAPTFRAPYWAALLAAHANEVLSTVTGKEPKAPLAGVRMARFKMFCDPAKAIRELGLPQTSPQRAVQDAIGWYRSNGFVRP